MELQTVQSQLTDLPRTFLRPNLTFTRWIAALTAGLSRYTESMDNTLDQVVLFDDAKFGWLDIWGLLFGVARLANESDVRYSPRIPYVVTAGGGPPVAICTWIKRVWNVETQIQETLGTGVGYTLQFLTPVTDAQAILILQSIARVRPAGVPFIVLDSAGNGIYLDTINFLDTAPDVTGAYLAETGVGAAPGVGATTNNAEPLLPDLLLIDPTLNPA